MPKAKRPITGSLKSPANQPGRMNIISVPIAAEANPITSAGLVTTTAVPAAEIVSDVVERENKLATYFHLFEMIIFNFGRS